MSRSFVTVLVALSLIVLVVVFTSAAVTRSQPIDSPPPTRSATTDRPTQPKRPDVPCLVVPSEAILGRDDASDSRPTHPSAIAAADVFTTTDWQLEAPIPTARAYFGLAARPGDHFLFAFGGIVSRTIALTSTERYDACAGHWTDAAPLPAPLGYVSAVEIDGLYYVVGGVDQVVSGTYGVQSTTYVYDPGANVWSQRANLPQALGGVALATANGKLYAFGGFDARGPSAGTVDTTYEFNPTQNAWVQRTALISGTRSLAGAASWHGKIYVAGGRTNGLDEYTSGLNTLIIYDPAANSWAPGASFGDTYYGFGFVVAPDDGLYALGGRGKESTANLRYDPQTDHWDQLSTWYSDDFRYGANAAYSRGRLFLVGGDLDNVYYPKTVTTQNMESLRIRDDFCLSTLTVDRTTAKPGDRIRYTIELHSGIEVLPAAGLIDPLPAGVTFAGFIANPIGAAYDHDLQRIHWSGSLNSFRPPVTLTFEVLVNQDLPAGTGLTNTATFESGLFGAVERAAVTRLDYVDLSSSVKLADQSALETAGRITYTVRVRDTSSQSGTFTMTDPIPISTTYIEGSLNASAGTAALNNGVLTWSGELPAIMTHTNTTADYEWGDSRGGGAVPGVQYDWIEISDTGRGFSWYAPADKDRCYPVPIPFSYEFYGTVITQTAVQIDGSMYFYGDPGSTYWVMGPDNQPIPSLPGAYLRGLIAVFWDDVYKYPGRMYYQVVGTAPHRRVVIEYHEVAILTSRYALGTPAEFELILSEDNNAVIMQYKRVDLANAETSFGASATIGLQDTFEHGLQYSYNTPSLSNELAIVYLPPQQTYTTTTRSVEVHYAVTTTLPALPVVNTATITDSHGAVIERRTVSFIPAAWVYLPIIRR